MRKLIITEGLPCSGKSTTAAYIAEKTGMKYVDEGTGDHPADYEFHSFILPRDLVRFSDQEKSLIKDCGYERCGGYIVPLCGFSGMLFDKLLQYKIYDFLPWETERPVMLDKWREFVREKGDAGHVFNCVFLQNPMCETMIRFGFDKNVSEGYIREIYDIIRPLEPLIVYLRTSDIRSAVEKAVPERGDEWLNAVIDYHCSGEYGHSKGLSGFGGYIKALEERQSRELEILSNIGTDHIIIEDPVRNWDNAYAEIMEYISEGGTIN